MPRCQTLQSQPRKPIIQVSTTLSRNTLPPINHLQESTLSVKSEQDCRDLLLREISALPERGILADAAPIGGARPLLPRKFECFVVIASVLMGICVRGVCVR